MTAVPLPGQYSFEEYEIYPADYEIVPIYDGTELKEINGWNNLIFWKDRLFAEINTLAERTSTSEVVGTVVLPIASVFLGMCFFVITSRRKSPETDPSSTPAKILRYIEEHPGCLQHQIAAGINKSRGSVAYQLYRLKKEKKVYFAINRSKSVRYYLSIDNASTVRYLMISALENEFQKNILQILHQYPQSTRHQIAEQLGKSPDTIYWHLNNIDPKLLTVHREKKGYQYSLSTEATSFYSEINAASSTQTPCPSQLNDLS